MNNAWWLVVVAACWTGSTAPPPKPLAPPRPTELAVLSRIESYKPPPTPPDATGAEAIADTYDSRLGSDTPVPPTLTDTLLCDLLQRLTLDFERDVVAADISESDMIDAIAVYTEKDWIHIAGFRPRAHWYFIRSLDARERALLARESMTRIRDQEPVCPD